MSTTPGEPSAPAPAGSPLQITERLPSHPHAVRLLRAFHSEQVDRYGFADPVDLNSGEYAPPNGLFAVAYQGATPAGCGGYRWFDRATHKVEIKRIYVVSVYRGHGTGRVLLAWLERHAAKAGAERAILETGVRNTAALSLFTSAGYQPVDRYVEGRDPEINLAFARTLASDSQPWRARGER